MFHVKILVVVSFADVEKQFRLSPVGFAFLGKLKLLLLKPHWDCQIWIWKENEKDSGPLTIVKREKYT